MKCIISLCHTGVSLCCLRTGFSIRDCRLKYGKAMKFPNCCKTTPGVRLIIHVLPRNSPHWQRHIAFRDYLQTYPTVKEEYQVFKEKLTKQVWRDGNEYNEAKNAFIKVVEGQALKWQSTQPK